MLRALVLKGTLDPISGPFPQICTLPQALLGGRAMSLWAFLPALSLADRAFYNGRTWRWPALWRLGAATASQVSVSTQCIMTAQLCQLDWQEDIDAAGRRGIVAEGEDAHSAIYVGCRPSKRHD